MRKKNANLPKPNPYSYGSWCNGNPYYEENGGGDGVLVKFFPNEAFEGKPEIDKAINLDFMWSGKKPHKEIP